LIRPGDASVLRWIVDGFTRSADRDTVQGLCYVRYVDVDAADQEVRGFLVEDGFLAQ